MPERVIRVRDGAALEVDLPDLELATMQAEIGGYIEFVALSATVGLLVDEEGMLKYPAPAFFVRTRSLGVTPIYGPALVVAHRGGEFRGFRGVAPVVAMVRVAESTAPWLSVATPQGLAGEGGRP